MTATEARAVPDAGPADDAPAPKVRRSELARWLARLVLVAVLGALVTAAFFDLALTSRGWDAHTLKAWAERADQTGTGIYTASANQRGPLWLLLYMAPLYLVGTNAYWFVIAAFILVVAGVTGVAVGAAVRWRTGATVGGWVGGVALAVYLVLGPEEYSQVLYSRNLASMLTVAAFALVWPAASATNRRRSAALVAAGAACAGLAVQTLPTAVIPCSVVGAALWASLWSRYGHPWARPVVVRVLAWSGTFAAVFASAPLYFAARGRFADFWDLYWRYNLVYSDATGRTLGQQLVKGLDDFATYYREHPLFLMAVVGFVISSCAQWRTASRLQRAFDIALIAWWVAELVAVTLAQRFFPHYLVLPLVPVAAMGAVLFARVSLVRTLVPLAVVPLLPALAAGFVVLTGWHRAVAGWEEAAAFSGFQDHADRQFLSDERYEPETSGAPYRRSQAALVDAVTARDEFLWVWSDWPGYYTNLSRAPATRYLSRHWLLGMVYGGETSADNILPGTFENWADDVRRTPPVLFLLPVPIDPPPRGPVDQWLRENFTPLYSGNGVHTVMRNDRYRALRDLLDGEAGTAAALVAGRAASTGGAIAVAAGGDAGGEPAPGAAARVTLPSACAIVSAQIVRDPTPGSAAVITLADPGGPSGAAEVALQPDLAVTRRWPNPSSAEAQAPLSPPPTDRPEELRVLVNGRSALVALDGAVVGAVRSSAADPALVLSAGAGRTVVTDVHVRELDARQWPACGSG